MPNDHYIPQFLTKPWEHDDRRLTFYDFGAKAFDTTSSKRLFAKEGLNSPAVEAMLGRFVESPIGAYLTEVRKNNAPLGPITDWETMRAMVLLFAFGTQRLPQVQGVTFPLTLDHFAATATDIDHLALAWTTKMRLFGLTLPPGQEMMFPEGSFAIPYEGPPALAIPVDLNHLVVTREHDLPQQQTDDYFAYSTFVALSVGLASRRVVLPPAAIAAKDHDEKALEAWMVGSRKTCAHLVNNFARVSELNDLPAFIAKL